MGSKFSFAMAFAYGLGLKGCLISLPICVVLLLPPLLFGKKMKSSSVVKFADEFKLPDGRHLPEKFRGAYWMQGNPQPDDLVCLHTGTWDAKERHLKLYITGDDCWTWHDNAEGWKKAYMTAAVCLSYNFYFDEKLEHARIYPDLLFSTRLPLNLIADFNMHYLGEGHWDRETVPKGNGEVGHYYLRRLINPGGSVNEKVKFELMSAAADKKDTACFTNQIYGSNS
eukprot:jgi/Bigna1/126539/aug1.2_g1247